MEITIRYTQECPNVAGAERNVREALRAARKRARIRRELISSSDDADRLRFVGSPTILVDGADPFADPRAIPGLACRIYDTPDGRRFAPSVSQLRDALEQAVPPGPHMRR